MSSAPAAATVSRQRCRTHVEPMLWTRLIESVPGQSVRRRRSHCQDRFQTAGPLQRLECACLVMQRHIIEHHGLGQQVDGIRTRARGRIDVAVAGVVADLIADGSRPAVGL